MRGMKGRDVADDAERPIRVLHIGGNARVNGISTPIMEVYRRIDRQRFQFHIYNSASTRGPHEEEIERLGGRVHRAYSTSRGVTRAVDQMWKLSTVLAKHGPFDVVHSHYYSMNGWYLLVAKIHGVPVRISHCHQSRTTGMSLSKRVLVRISRFLVRLNATARLGCSEAACRFLYGQQASETLLSGVDYQRFDLARYSPDEARRAFGLDPQNKYLVFIGRLETQKNCAFLITALSDLLRRRQDSRLLILGNGTLKDSLTELVRSCHLEDQVIFVPAPADVAKLLSVSEVLLLPSLWEGLAIVLLEAQAMGVPCLASDFVPREADLGLCTYLPLDPQRWESTVETMLRQERPKTPRTDARFDIDNVARRLTELYAGAAEVGNANS